MRRSGASPRGLRWMRLDAVVVDEAWSPSDENAPEAIAGMVVDDADRLHPGVDDSRTDELEAATFELPGNLLGEGRGDDSVTAIVLHDRAVSERPAEIGEALAVLVHLAVDLRAADRRLDLGASANDAFVAHQPRDVGGAECRDLLRIEASEGAAESLALAQDDAPREAGLEAFQHQHLPQHAGVVLRHAPLLVVVGAHERIVAGPGATSTLNHQFTNSPI